MAAASPPIAEVGHLVGDPARANILAALMDGRARTATELAYAAHVSPKTMSAHLDKLTDARLLRMEKQGRHRYFRLASPLVAHIVEAVMVLAAQRPPRYRPPSKVDEQLRNARTCYDHLAGRLGVGLADAMAARAFVVLEGDGGEVTSDGMVFLTKLGIDLTRVPNSRRAFCRPCLDWSERRAHLGGQVGASLARFCFDQGWIARNRDGRAVIITRAGARRMVEVFGRTSSGLCAHDER